MSGPSTKPTSGSAREPVFGPHPDDVDAVRDALAAVERGEVLSPEESAAYLKSLLGSEDDGK
jgi:hypothetical protein